MDPLNARAGKAYGYLKIFNNPIGAGLALGSQQHAQSPARQLRRRIEQWWEREHQHKETLFAASQAAAEPPLALSLPAASGWFDAMLIEVLAADINRRGRRVFLAPLLDPFLKSRQLIIASRLNSIDGEAVAPMLLRLGQTAQGCTTQGKEAAHRWVYQQAEKLDFGDCPKDFSPGLCQVT